ncbi:MAG TPA: 7-cyano-7-deazaguanine synthase [Gemmataceae bacterium]|jgi:7-cyano-7-deazaguanine synthase|nr:7-cyano-7-deazaguanine synthase [Gemmataceae bacterium]
MSTPSWPPERADHPLAVLVSGGLDSAVLVGEAVRHYAAVHPIYVRADLAWEDVELVYLRRFLAAVAGPTLKPLVVLSTPVSDLYGTHWSLTGRDVPDDRTADEAVFLPGRNVILFAKPLIWCHLNGVPELATAPLAANPFPDATPEFYAALAGAVNMGMAGRVAVVRPYQHLHKADVVRRGRGLPLEHTFSCLRPVGGLHCGRCNKCAERRAGFAAAGVPDPTRYT